MDIVVIGSGNIATHLAANLSNLGHDILQVYSRNIANAEALAMSLPASAIDSIDAVNTTASLYILAVSDGALQHVIDQLPKSLQGTVVHTSGATPISILEDFNSYGVIYPAQSINKKIPVQLNEIPFGIEGNTPQTTVVLTDLISQLSSKAFFCDTDQRLALHTAAVFANNFSNVLYTIAYDILESHHLSFELLKPIILETAKKVQSHHPKDTQTGPAKRNDNETIQRHLKFLSENPKWLKIYQQLTEEIKSGNSF